MDEERYETHEEQDDVREKNTEKKKRKRSSGGRNGGGHGPILAAVLLTVCALGVLIYFNAGNLGLLERLRGYQDRTADSRAVDENKLNGPEEAETETGDTAEADARMDAAGAVTDGGNTQAPVGRMMVMDVSDIVERVMPCVVAITNKSVREVEYWFWETEVENESSGSGFVIAKTQDELLIATNAHVVEDARSLSVCFTVDNPEALDDSAKEDPDEDGPENIWDKVDGTNGAGEDTGVFDNGQDIEESTPLDKSEEERIQDSLREILEGGTDSSAKLDPGNAVPLSSVYSSDEDSSMFPEDTAVVEAVVKGMDKSRDLAVVAVAIEDIPDWVMDQIVVATLGSSSKLRVGQPVVAIGNALGYGQSVTLGIVSALNRQLQIDGAVNQYIQTDAAINFGNSGGILINIDGEVVGINSAKTVVNGAEGMGYAIPIDDATEILEELMNMVTRMRLKPEEQGYLGIDPRDLSAESRMLYNIPKGAYINEVAEGSPADRAGIRKGDIIVGFEGNTITSATRLSELLDYYGHGETVSIQLYTVNGRRYQQVSVEVTLE